MLFLSNYDVINYMYLGFTTIKSQNLAGWHTVNGTWFKSSI